MEWINKTSLRKINVQNERYLWKRGHYHPIEFEHSNCVEKVIIYLEGYKNSSLHLLFRTEDNLLLNLNSEKEKWCLGYPDDGVIWLFKPREDKKPQTINININLNRPAVIAKLIEHFIAEEWKPKVSKKPLIKENALLLIEKIELPKGIN
ncbi:MAG: hypothetical protein AB8H03_28700 [Saprospiraceae bacterium]